jgi:hypothetical protein
MLENYGVLRINRARGRKALVFANAVRKFITNFELAAFQAINSHSVMSIQEILLHGHR